MSRPLVSVVLCTFNRPAGLRSALGSIALQGVDAIETVVVNGGGPDIAHVVAEFADLLIVRLITLPTDRGLAYSRKTGVAAARGQYVAFLDDDDLWLPEHLRTTLAGIGDVGTDLVYTSCLVAERQHHLGYGDPVVARYRFDYRFDVELLAVTNMIPVISVLARRFDPNGLDTDRAIQEDWAMWLGLVLGRGWHGHHLQPATTIYHRIPTAESMTGAAAAGAAGLRRFAEGHRWLHERWPVAPDSPAGRARGLPHRMYALVAGRHSAALPLSHYYYERSLPVIASVVSGRLSVDAAEAALADAVAPDAIEHEERAA
jgi:glycosyltransferase involved in cell wall biosynthesis